MRRSASLPTLVRSIDEIRQASYAAKARAPWLLLAYRALHARAALAWPLDPVPYKEAVKVCFNV